MWNKALHIAVELRKIILYLAFEGNGRIAAMQKVFTPSDGIEVEVEQYHFRNTRKIVRRLNRVRRLNGLHGTSA